MVKHITSINMVRSVLKVAAKVQQEELSRLEIPTSACFVSPSVLPKIPKRWSKHQLHKHNYCADNCAYCKKENNNGK